MVDENLAHHSRRYGIEVRAILVTRTAVIYQPQVSFVNQSGGLQGVILRFAPQIPFRDAVQFLVDQRNQEIERPLFAAIDS